MEEFFFFEYDSWNVHYQYFIPLRVYQALVMTDYKCWEEYLRFKLKSQFQRY